MSDIPFLLQCDKEVLQDAERFHAKLISWGSPQEYIDGVATSLVKLKTRIAQYERLIAKDSWPEVIGE